MPNEQYSPGYYTGVLDVYYAKMSTADSPAAKPTYGTPASMGKTIEVTITPNYKEGSVYASNAATRSERRVNTYTVSLNADRISSDVLTDVLGREKDSNGVQLVKGAQQAPYVAIMFALTLDDDSKELWCLYKGKFSEPSQTGHTDSDTTTYQHPTIEATFVRREYDDLLAAVADTADDSIGQGVESSWFNEVYETP